MVRGPATILTILVMKKCSSDSFQVDPSCGAAVSPVQDDDECEAHAAFLVESQGFGVLDCGATTFHENDTRIPEVDPLGGRSFNFGDGASSKATSCPDPQSEMMLLVTSGSLCICSWISRNRLR